MEKCYEDKASTDNVGVPFTQATDEFLAFVIFPSHGLESGLESVK